MDSIIVFSKIQQESKLTKDRIGGSLSEGAKYDWIRLGLSGAEEILHVVENQPSTTLFINLKKTRNVHDDNLCG